jgi:hypothetical protein
VQLWFWGGSQTLARPSSNVEHPVVPLTPNKHIPLLAITLASGIAIALLALQTPDFQPQDSLPVGPNLAPLAVEPTSEADDGTELLESRIHVADQSAAPSDIAESSTDSATQQDTSAASCSEGYEPRDTTNGNSECVLLGTAPKAKPALPKSER